MPESNTHENKIYIFEQNPALIDFKLNQEQVEDLIRYATLPDVEPAEEMVALFNKVTGIENACESHQ